MEKIGNSAMSSTQMCVVLQHNNSMKSKLTLIKVKPHLIASTYLRVEKKLCTNVLSLLERL